MSTKQAVIEEIQERIRLGVWRPGQRLPTERELAKLFGVSRASVQRAIQDLEAFGSIHREPNCRPVITEENTGATAPGQFTADQVAVWILPGLQDLGGVLMLQGIRSVCGDSNYRLLIDCTPAHQSREVVEQAELDFVNSLLRDTSIAGAIIWETGSPGFDQAFHALESANIPVVFIDREPPASIKADVVMTNHRRAAKRAVKHLIDLGHRNIAMVLNHERATSVQDRVEGYRSALQDARILFREDLLVELPIEAIRDVRTATEQVLLLFRSMADPPTAIFAVNDTVALFLEESAKGLGMRIPQDFALVGFDWLMRNLPSGGNLTTIAQPFQDIGATAARRLLHRIGADRSEVTRQILLDAPLVIRASTDKPAHPSSHSPKGDSYAQTQ
jgi:DNA-binding LacI/PurR family transcriptional regulator